MNTNCVVPFLLAVPALLSAGSTSVALTSSANPVIFGHPVTLTAVVTPSSASGVVTFYSGTAVLETERLVNGQTTLSTILLPFGSQSLRADYLGDATDEPSTSPLLTLTVNTVPESALAPRVNYPAGTLPYGVAIADFNADGKADLATANLGGNNVSVLLGNGDGSFQSAVYYGVSENPGSIAVGDFNGDGRPDLVTGSTQNGGFSVLLGNSDGTFKSAGSSIGGDCCYAIAVGDFNGDGKADIAGSNYYSALLFVFLGNGDGTFQSPLSTNAFGGSSIVIGDFNGDGKADVAVANSNNSDVTVLLGKGDGTFDPQVTYPADCYDCDSIALGDFNGDGKTDMAVTGSQGNTVAILLGNGDGTFHAPVTYVSGTYYTPYVAVGDFNGDGKADLVLGGNSLGVMLGNGDGSFQPPVIYTGGYGFVAVSDFNGDGRADVVAVNGQNGFDASISLGVTPQLTTTALASSVNPSYYGESVTLTATVSPSTASGIVTFYQGSTSLGTGTLSDGNATLTVSTLRAGEHSLAAAYGGDPYDQPSTSPNLTQRVHKATTSTILESLPNPSTFRQNVTLKVTVSPSAATGIVTFYGGSNALGKAALRTGSAAISLSTLSAGPHSLTASYAGDANDANSTSAALIQIVRDTTSTVLTSSPNPSNLNQAVTFVAMVSPASATGTVTFYHGSTAVGAGNLTNGKATLSVSSLSAGSHAITATYNGNSIDAPSTSAILTQVVE